MLWTLCTLVAELGAFCLADKALTALGAANPYYLLHSIHNAYIVWLTAPDVMTTFTHFDRLTDFPVNMPAVTAVVALHLYHCALYWQKFRYDDWLHHGLMIFYAIPVTLLMPQSTLLAFSLFFMTGLPGGIDYFLLFMVRNGCLGRRVEKRVNRWLNLWIRSPGGSALAALSAAAIFSEKGREAGAFMQVLWFTPALLNYWNGQYFMEQVVSDWARLQVEDSRRDE